jgi:hypothetical protein
MSNDGSVKLVTIGGECFEASFQEKVTAAGRDGISYLFSLSDLKSERGSRLISLFRSGPTKLGIQNYDASVGSVRLNAMRRAFDNRNFSFDAPYDKYKYEEIPLTTEDFQKQRPKSDSEIRRYIIHKAYWLSYRYPRQTMPSDVLLPIQFDEPIDLEYLGTSRADMARIVFRLGNQGLLEKSLVRKICEYIPVPVRPQVYDRVQFQQL